MKYRRALELFFLRAKEEFDKRKTTGNESEVGRVTYFGCKFADGKVKLMGQRILHATERPLVLPEHHEWKEGVEVFEAIMKDLTG